MGFLRFASRVCGKMFSPFHPQWYSQKESLSGLQYPAECRFNSKGIPVIEAKTEEDLFFLQGYLHARERLWQMELTRATYRGQLASLLGKISLNPPSVSHQLQPFNTVDFDRFVRTFGLWESGKKGVEKLSTSFRPKLEAYCHGVNTHLQQIQKNPQLAPLELKVLKHTLALWTLEDCCAVEKLFAFQLNYSWRSLLVLHLIEAQKKETAPWRFRYPDHHPPLTQTVPGELLALEESARNFVSLGGRSIGSNAWIISGKWSQSGKPLFANDPHLSLLVPSNWYFIGLQAPSFNVAGASLPGTPGIVLGHNKRLAWGFTNAMADDADLYEEELNPEGTHYRQGEEWRPLQTRQEVIRVKKEESQTVTVRATERGPLISDCFPNTSLHLSLKWAMHQTSCQVENFYHLAQAQTKEELVQAMEPFVAPAQNLMYADIHGNIGYHLIGKIPIRPGDRALKIQLGKNVSPWQGYVPYDALPALENPESGLLVTANQKLEDEQYPYYISHFYEPGYRANRIYACLQERKQWDIKQFATLFQDVYSLHAEQFLQKYLTCLKPQTDLENQAVQFLREWNREMQAESVGACIFNVWYVEALKALLLPYLGTPLFYFYTEILHQASTPFEELLAGKFKVFSEAEIQDTLNSSFRISLAFLQEKFGATLQNWEWGKLHQLPLRHLLGGHPLFRDTLNLGPIPGRGASMTVDNGTFSFAKPYDQLIGASCRFIADLSNLEQAGFSLPSGQSGHWDSPHYGNMLEDWKLGQFSVIEDRVQQRKEFSPEKNEPSPPH